MRVKVLAPYVTLLVQDRHTGAEQILGYYEGAVVDASEGKILTHHLDRGLVEPEKGEKAEAKAAGSEDDDGESGSESKDDDGGTAKKTAAPRGSTGSAGSRKSSG